MAEMISFDPGSREGPVRKFTHETAEKSRIYSKQYIGIYAYKLTPLNLIQMSTCQRFYLRFEFGAYEDVYALQVTSNGSHRKGQYFALESTL